MSGGSVRAEGSTVEAAPPEEQAATEALERELERERRAEFWSLPDHALVDRDTVAAVRYVKRQTIELEAIKGGGVPYRRIGRRALSTKADVLVWIEAQSNVVTNTAQLPQKAHQ